MAEYRWRKFSGRRSRTGSDAPRVAVYKGATFNLNRAAYEAIGSPGRVVFYFDDDTRTIGIRGARSGDSDAESYPLQNPDSAKSSYYVTVVRFARTEARLADTESLRWEPATIGTVDGSPGVILPLLGATKSAVGERRTPFVTARERELALA